MSRRPLLLPLALLLLLLLAAPLLAPSPASAFKLIPDEDGSVDVTGQLAGMPPRHTITVQRGQRLTRTVSFQNRMGETVRLRVEPRGIGAAPEGSDPILLVNDAAFGAEDWLELDRRRVVLEHGDKVDLDVRVRVPDDAEPGDHYAAIIGSVQPISDDSTAASQVQLAGAVAPQLFFTVPGDRKADGRIVDVESPRVAFKDAGRYVPIRFSFENVGNVRSEVSGAVEVDGMFGGRVANLRIEPSLVLRGGTREMRVLWSETPWIGRFTPTIRLQDGEGNSYQRQLPPIVVLPPWYWFAALLASLLLALAWWRRERRRRRLYDMQMAAFMAAADARARAAYGDDDPDEDYEGYGDGGYEVDDVEEHDGAL